jgi:hypothetical protein
VWSPCSRFIAINFFNLGMVKILDSVTLQKLQTLKLPQDTYNFPRAFTFSPDSCALTCFSGSYGNEYRVGEGTELLVSWDLQTGGVASIIECPKPEDCVVEHPSITYSANGKLVGVFYWQCNDNIKTTNISIFDITSGVYMYSHSLDGSIQVSDNIWTHGESLQFATADATTVTIWEVGSISAGTPTEVETLPAPDNFGLTVSHGDNHIHSSIQFLHTACLLSLTVPDRVLVWDVQNSRCLLDYIDVGSFFGGATFSSDGCFFACTTSSNIYLWKKSSSGYILYGVPAPKTHYSPNLLLSQNGESMAMFYNSTIWLCHTNSFATHPSSISTKMPQKSEDFTMDFSPDGIFAAVARKGSNTAVVLNLKSGVPQLTISVDISICGLGMIGNTIIVMGGWKAIAWDLPAEGCVPDVTVGLEDSSWTTNLEGMPAILGGSQGEGEWNHGVMIGASISPDSSCIALTALGVPRNKDGVFWFLCIYSVSTGGYLGHQVIDTKYTPWFAPDGCNIWCANSEGEVVVWRVGGKEDVLKCLWHTLDPEHPPEGYPWAPSCGYQVTDEWWILSPGGKRLLMLPPLWQSEGVECVWKGQFLALIHRGLLEPVILEVEP